MRKNLHKTNLTPTDLDELYLAAIFSARAEEYLEQLLEESSDMGQLPNTDLLLSTPQVKHPSQAGGQTRQQKDSSFQALPLRGSNRGTCSVCTQSADWIMRRASGEWRVCCEQHFETTVERLAQ